MTQKIKALILFTFLAITQFVFAQADRTSYLADPDGRTREHNFDVQHIFLDVAFVPDSGKVMGTVEHTFVPTQKDVDTVFLDAPGITIKEVKLDKEPVKFTTDKKGLTVKFNKTLHWDEKHVLSITYECHPRKGLYFIGWNDPNNRSRKQIWSQGQGVDNRYWIPSFDDLIDKAVTEVQVRFDKDYKVLSNGELLEEKVQKDGKTKLWHYKMTHPHSSYLIMLGIGKYEISKTKSKSGVAINNYYYPELPETVEPTYRYTDQMMDFLEKETGVAFPWNSYSQIPVQDFMFGAMENTTATVFGDFSVLDKRAFLDRPYIGTNCHEMTHDWFGDYITARNPAHHWLQESFATHYSKWFERSIFGDDHFQWIRHGELLSVYDAAKSNNNPISHSQAGSPRVYPKGSLVLDMLKYVVGKEQFDRAVNHYLKAHPYSNVDTKDFYLTFQETLGINLDWFFDEWLYKGGEPHYTVTYQKVAANTQFMVKQTQTQDGLVGLFKMPIVFEVHYTDGTTSQVREWVAKETETINVPNASNKEIDYVLFDPNSEIIKFIEFKKGFAELTAQATKATNMIDRYDALVGLKEIPFDQKKTLLIDLYGKEKFWANRAEIAKQLLKNANDLDVSLVKKMLQDPNARVRQSVLAATEKIPAALLTDYEALLKDSSYWNEEDALVKLSTQYPDNTQRYLDITKNDNGIGNKLHITWLEIAAGKDKKYIADLVEHVSNSYEFRTRGNACDALKRLNYLDQKALGYMVDCVLNPNSRLAGPAIAALNYFKGQNEYKKVLKDYYTTHKWETWQDEILKPVLN